MVTLLTSLLLLTLLVYWLYTRRKFRVIEGGKKSNPVGKVAIALTSQTPAGKVRRKILANLRKTYPGQSEAWYQRQADERFKDWENR